MVYSVSFSHSFCFFGAGIAVLLRGSVPGGSGCAQLRTDHQRGRNPTHVGGNQGWRHGDQAVLLRGALHPVEQGERFPVLVFIVQEAEGATQEH